ncbi:MAG: hypothetical protein ACRD4Y_10385 [Candidatus Acidiferrales bacterium]
MTHVLAINGTWIVPTPKSLPSVANYALGGWQLGGILSVRSGLPFTPIIGGDPLGLNTDDFTFPNRSKSGACASATTGDPAAYINVSCFSLPVPNPAITGSCARFGQNADGSGGIAGTCANLVGNAGRNSLRGPGLIDFDFSLFKNNYIPRISESFNIQFRAEMFNVLNRPNFLSPAANSTIFFQDGTSVGGAGLINGTSTDPRRIQFGLKVIW